MKNNFFYQIYMIKNSKIMWIVRESDNYKELKNYIEDFSSQNERYMIIKVKYTDEEIDLILKSKFKKFKRFIFQKSDKIIFDTTQYEL